MSEVYGWTGKILRVDLSSGEISTVDTMKYVPDFIGGLGIASRIAWEELAPGVDGFDPENMLFVMVGPLTGTLASGAGRVEVLGIVLCSTHQGCKCRHHAPSPLMGEGWDGGDIMVLYCPKCYNTNSIK